jgi:hypothetical protein
MAHVTHPLLRRMRATRWLMRKLCPGCRELMRWGQRR